MLEDRYVCPWCKAEVADDAWACLYCGKPRPRTILAALVALSVVGALVFWFVT